MVYIDPLTAHELLNLRTGRIVLAKIPAAVHVKGKLRGIGADYVVAGFIGRSGSAGTGDGMAVVIEEVGFNQGTAAADDDRIAERPPLHMVEVVVVDVHVRMTDIDSTPRPVEDLVVVKFHARPSGRQTLGCGQSKDVAPGYLAARQVVFGKVELVFLSPAFRSPDSQPRHPGSCAYLKERVVGFRVIAE